MHGRSPPPLGAGGGRGRATVPSGSEAGAGDDQHIRPGGEVFPRGATAPVFVKDFGRWRLRTPAQAASHPGTAIPSTGLGRDRPGRLWRMRASLIAPIVLCALAACLAASCRSAPPEGEPVPSDAGERVVSADLCVYGATSAGVVAAVQARRMGRSVVLVDCDGWVGGMSASGLGAVDIGNKQAIGGLAREFHRAVKRHYDDPASWTLQAREDHLLRGHGHSRDGDAAWTFEPSVASAIFAGWLREARVEPLRARLSRPEHGDNRDGVDKRDGRILAALMEDGTRVEARMWLDCSHEGDLMAAAGVEFRVGREANAEHGETLNGVQVAQAAKHQFAHPVSARVDPADARGALLPGIEASAGMEGGADRKVQAYCFRMCVTDVARNRLPWPRPAEYDEREFELLLRHFDAGSTMAPWHPLWMPNRKTDANNNGAVSTDMIGGSWEWPEASHARRAELHAAHLRWQQGLMWTLANHPRVPRTVRDEISACGPTKDEFVATGGWPPLLYVREARRLRGVATMTEHHCMSREVVDDSVGLGAYTMDSHHVQRHVDEHGDVRNEGDVQVRVPRPYPIAWRALLPRREQCSNLVVPVCLSATHIAHGSIRMEPVYMVLGQSAATAACLALERSLDLHELPYADLRRRLLADGQVLDWTP